MLSKKWWQLSWRWLFSKNSNPKQVGGLAGSSVYISILGLALGVMGISLTVAIFSGFQKSMSDALVSRHGHFVQLFPPAQKQEINQMIANSKDFDIKYKQFFWQSPALIMNNHAGRGIQVEGIWPFEFRSDNLSKLEKSTTSDEPIVLGKIGKSLAIKMSVNIGDQVSIIVPSLIKKPINIKIVEIKDFLVKDLNDRYLVVDHEKLKAVLVKRNIPKLNSVIGGFQGVKYYLNSSYDGIHKLPHIQGLVDKYSNNIATNSKNFFNSKFLLWDYTFKNFLISVNSQKRYLVLVFLLLLLVSVVNMAAAMFTLFFERDKEIAMIRIMGMANGQLFWWLFIQGLYLGLVGATLGICCSFVAQIVLPFTGLLKVPEEIYKVANLRLEFIFIEQLYIFLGAVAVSLVMVLVVFWGLKNMKPSEVLSHRR